MKTIKITIILFLLPTVIFAKDILKGHVYDKDNQPLIGASVQWENSKTGVITNEDGYFEIEGTPGKDHMLNISYVGFKDKVVHIHNFSDTQTIILQENTELNEVVVERSRPGTVKSRTSLLQTEQITTRELHRAACCNLSESFETNPSVDVSFSDAVTGAKQIQLLGLAGTYVQMLTENYPNFRGAASIYGMDYIPGPWMESIQISKGTASVKNGYESITGQMNVEYKKPGNSDPLSLNIFASDAGRYEGNADAAFILNDKLSTGVFLHYSNETSSHDDNDDSFLDMPKKHQFNVMNRWHYVSGKYASQFGLRFIQDYRTSGQTMHTLNDASQNTDPYEISVKTNRAEFYTKNSYILDEKRNGNIALIFTGSYHDQKSQYAANRYNVYENNIYASLMYETELGKQHQLSTGLSLNWDKFNQSIHLVRPITNQPDEETTAGGYIQYTFNKDDKFIALAGLRTDYSSLHEKAFVTPRIHLKYMPVEWLNLRASAGKGYRSVFVMPENSYFLASNRKIEIADNLKQESAWNYGTSISFYIPIRGEELSITGEWYRTDFDNQVVSDIDSDPHAVKFYNLNKGKSYANSFQIEASYPLFRGFTILGAYRWMNAKTEYNGKLMRKPLISDYKALATASYETKLRKWVFDFTAQFNGEGRMPTPDATNPLWDTRFKSYTVLNAQVTKNFRTWSVYLGAENITNFKQKNPIVSPENPFGDDFDATMVWGPTQGRKFYIGLRYAIGK